MKTCSKCHMVASKYVSPRETHIFCLYGHAIGRGRCEDCITDEDILLAQREECSKKKLCFINDCRKCPVSVIPGRDPSYGTVAFDSAVEGAEAATDEDVDADKLICSNCSFACKSDTRVFPPRFSSSIGIYNSIPLPRGVLYCPERDTRVPSTLEGCELHSERKKDGEGNLDEVNSLDNTIDECFREMKRLINTGMQFGVDLASEESKTAYVFYVPVDRDKQKDKDIDECFRETERLIDGTSKNTRPPEQLRKEAAITKRIRAERDALRVCNEKLSKDNEALRDKVSFLKANSKVIARYAELQDKDLEQKYEEFGLAVDKYSSLVDKHSSLADKYSHLTDERNELKEKINSLEKELAASKEEVSKLCIEIGSTNLDLAAHQSLNLELEAKLARIKEELSGKWRLLEDGERFESGTDEIYDPHERCWREVRNVPTKGSNVEIIKSSYLPIRRKITI